MNPRVCVEADEVVGQDYWASVLVSGRHEELANSPKYAALRLNAHSLLDKRALWRRPAFATSETRGQRFGPFQESWVAPAQQELLSVRAERISAKQVKKVGITYFSFVFTIFFSL